MPDPHRAHLSARYFPNVSAGGHYSPHTLSITLDTSPPPDGIGSSPEREDWFRSHLPLIAHEYQHGLDHVGTLAGRKLLDALRNAYAALELKVVKLDQAELYRWVEFHDLQKRFYRRAYFTENDPTYRAPVETRPKWGWDTSIGRGFDLHGHPDIQDPIFFARFHDLDREVKIARQPLTAAALFEARAIACELGHLVMMKAVEFGRDKAKWAAFNAHQQALFYDVDLTLYSAPVHMLATQLGISDPVLAYRLTAILSWIVLNITDDLPFNPTPPRGWDGINGDADTLKRRLVELRDPGYLFFSLLVWSPPFDGDENAWLDETLRRAGFPARDVIENAAFEVLALPDGTSGNSWFDHIYFQAFSSGAVNAKRLRSEFGLFGQNTVMALQSDRGPVALPNTIVGDVVLAPLMIDPFMSIGDQQELGRFEEMLADQMGEFLGACR